MKLEEKSEKKDKNRPTNKKKIKKKSISVIYFFFELIAEFLVDKHLVGLLRLVIVMHKLLVHVHLATSLHVQVVCSMVWVYHQCFMRSFSCRSFTSRSENLTKEKAISGDEMIRILREKKEKKENETIEKERKRVELSLPPNNLNYGQITSTTVFKLMI